MYKQQLDKGKQELKALCTCVRNLATAGEYKTCEQLVYEAMGKYPHAPEPHNLIGILLEREGDHLTAMKHFRAATALDPNYLPAKHNLNGYGTFYARGHCAFDEGDCPAEKTGDYIIDYDAHGIGHVVRRI